MNQLKVVSNNGQLVTDSRDVAKMIGKEHKELMRSIRQYSGILTSADLRSLDFFIPDYYQDAKKEQRPCFLLTKKGCDMVANKMTGEKGVLFTAEYVTRFEEMEKEFQAPRVLNDKEKLMASMKLSIEATETLEHHNERLSYLEDHMRIDGVQEYKINQLGKKKVIKSLGGYKSPAYQELSGKLFARFWRDFKQHFMIPRYSELPRKNFDEAIDFIKAWQPDTSTRLEIQATNRQQTIQEVI